MESLKSCPFCGGNNITIEVDVVNPDKIFSGQAVCDECDARGKPDFWHDDEHEAKEGAVKAWNTRTFGWISVVDALPESDCECLCYSKNTLSNETCLDVFHFVYIANTFCRRFGVEVTHWMPLPEAPEVKHEAN